LASANLLIRAVESPDVLEKRLRSHLGEHVELVPSKSYGPVEFFVPGADGETATVDGPVVAFGTDAPFLRRWGQPLLYGPGSIRDAHTAHEHLTEASFEQAVADYERTARRLLERIDAQAGGR
jgi:acetylornithine deacetylase